MQVPQETDPLQLGSVNDPQVRLLAVQMVEVQAGVVAWHALLTQEKPAAQFPQGTPTVGQEGWNLVPHDPAVQGEGQLAQVPALQNELDGQEQGICVPQEVTVPQAPAGQEGLQEPEAAVYGL